MLPSHGGKQKADGFPSAFLLEKICYFAYSTRLTSLITFTLICPGYSSSASSFFAISFAMNMVFESSTSSGLTITLISLPAWIYRVNYRAALLEFLSKFYADSNVSAFEFVVDGFTYVV